MPIDRLKIWINKNWITRAFELHPIQMYEITSQTMSSWLPLKMFKHILIMPNFHPPFSHLYFIALYDIWHIHWVPMHFYFYTGFNKEYMKPLKYLCGHKGKTIWLLKFKPCGWLLSMKYFSYTILFYLFSWISIPCFLRLQDE